MADSFAESAFRHHQAELERLTQEAVEAGWPSPEYDALRLFLDRTLLGAGARQPRARDRDRAALPLLTGHPPLKDAPPAAQASPPSDRWRTSPEMLQRRGEFVTAARELAECGEAGLGAALAAGMLRFAAAALEAQARGRGTWDQVLYDASERGNATALAELTERWAAARRREAQG